VEVEGEGWADIGGERATLVLLYALSWMVDSVLLFCETWCNAVLLSYVVWKCAFWRLGDFKSLVVGSFGLAEGGHVALRSARM